MKYHSVIVHSCNLSPPGHWRARTIRLSAVESATSRLSVGLVVVQILVLMSRFSHTSQSFNPPHKWLMKAVTWAGAQQYTLRVTGYSSCNKPRRYRNSRAVWITRC